MNLFLENVYEMLETPLGRGGGGFLSHTGGLLPGKGGYFRRFGSLPFYLRSMTVPIAHPKQQKTMI